MAPVLSTPSLTSTGGNILFLLGLPGTFKDTVRQLLAAAPEIQADHEDSWLMLPLLYQRRQTGIETEYNHNKACIKTAQFLSAIPDGELRYTEGLRRLATDLYSARQQPHQRYVLDASDRYYHIIPQLQALLPEARFIFALGNPLDPVRHILHDKFQGHFPSLYQHDDIYRDLYTAPGALAQGVKEADARCFILTEADLEGGDAQRAVLSKLSSWLGLEKPIRDKDWHEVHEKSKHVTAAGLPPLPKRPINGAYLHAATTYLEHLGDETLRIFGYDGSALRHHLLVEALGPAARSLVDRLPADIVAPLYGDSEALFSLLLDAMLAEQNAAEPLTGSATEVPQSLRGQIAESVVWLGEQRYEEGNEVGAHDAFTVATELDSTCARAFSNLAVILHQRGDTRGAQDLLFRSHAANPDDLTILSNLCTLLKEAGNIAEGRQLAMNYLSRHPDSAEAMSLFIEMN
ncbi:MAG: sulfotransferase [Actinomycetota bacterium]